MLVHTSSSVDTSSPGRLRLSPQVSAVRQSVPYLNYAPPPFLGAYLNSEGPQFEPQPQDTWSGNCGYGARHRLDEAPFSLWDETEGDFRVPTPKETRWIVSMYNADAIAYQFPVIVIVTEQPPNPLPLTVAAVAAKFVASTQAHASDNTFGKMGPKPIFDARPTHFTTDYAGMRGPEDPLDFTFKKWIQPPRAELQLLVHALSHFCHPRHVHVMYPRVIVELYCDDGRTYEPGSLPRTIGGYSTHYHHSNESVFAGLSLHARQRLIGPTHTVEDTSNYLQAYQELCPGIRVSSGSTPDIGLYAQASTSTTAGLLIHDNHGHQRLTVSNQAFLKTNQVFHPTHNDTQIGDIVERFPHLDVALVELNPSITFTNSTYFEAKKPRRLLRSHEISNGAWFAVDGISTGVVFLQAQGLTLACQRRSPGVTAIAFSEWIVYRGFGALGVVPLEGIRGAAIVEENTEDCGVAGFVQHGNADWVLAPCLGELIDGSWGVV